MADAKLVELLKQGSEVWNRWREQQSKEWRIHSMEFYPSDLGLDEIEWNVNNTIRIDLGGADLRGADLYGANLMFANLSEADLSGAILHRANLTLAVLHQTNMSGTILHRADLHRANLIEANLSEATLRYANLNMVFLHRAILHRADLTFANLSEADLIETDLSEANLSEANLSEANLEKANLTGTNITGTQFDSLDLRSVIGLETAWNYAPAPIGLDTIYRSHGQIPEAFLRSAGVPETFITNMRAIVKSMSPIEFYSCFIAYNHQDEDFAKRLHADLQDRGVRCWFAPENLKVGDHYHQRIDEAIRHYDKLILVLSEAAVNSAWVEREVVAAREKEDRQHWRVLFPLRVDEAVIETCQAWAADVRRRWHIGDFTRWKDHDAYQQTFERLLRDLKKANEQEHENGEH